MNANQKDANALQQRRYLSVLFGDLSGSTALALTLETEIYARMILDLHNLYDACVQRYGGTIVQLEGDGVLACFGYPKAGESDVRNAVRAALDITEGARLMAARVPEIGTLDAHCGVHTGRVLLQTNPRSAVGFSLFGTAVNIAAKLSDKAEAGQVLVSAASLGRDKGHFQLGNRRDVPVGGIGEPISVVQVTGVEDQHSISRTSPTDDVTPFTGREAEFQRLSELLNLAMNGQQCAVAVVGQPGVGKTRIVRELLSRLQSQDVFFWQVQCEDQDSAEPLGPVLQILRRIFGVRRSTPSDEIVAVVQAKLAACEIDGDEHLDTLLGVLRPGLSTKTKRHPAQIPDITRSLIAVLDALAPEKPQIITIEDLQWADQESRLIIDTVCRSLTGRRIVITTVRDSESFDVNHGAFELVRLDPLPESDARRLVSALAPGVSDFDCDNILRSSGGNTLYIEELCHSNSQRSKLQNIGKELSRSAWLEKLIDARMNDLSEDHREVLRTASVIGTEAPLPLLQAVLNRPVDHASIDELSRQHFLYQTQDNGALRFKHSLTRDIVYSTVPWHHGRNLHNKIADEIADKATSLGYDDHSELLAYHYKAAEVWNTAARFSEIAGRKATAVSALDQAQKHYFSALDCIRVLGLRPENYGHWLALARSLALACVYDPSREQLSLLETAVDVAQKFGTEREICEARFWAGYIAYALGSSARALTHLELAATEALAVDDPELTTQIRACLGQAYAAGSRYGVATSLLDQTIDVKRKYRKPGRPAVSLAYSLACRAAVMGDRGEFDDAFAYFDEAIHGLAGSHHEVESSVLCWKSGVLLWQGRWSAAQSAASRAMKIAEDVRSLYLIDMSQSLRSFAEWRTSGDAAAVARLKRATARLEAGDKRLFLSLNYGWLAQIKLAASDLAGLRSAAARTMMLSRQMDLLGCTMAYRSLAIMSAQRQNQNGVEIYLDRAMRHAKERQSRHEIAKTEMLMAELFVGKLRHGERDRLLDSAEQAFGAMAMDWHLARIAEMRADIDVSVG